MNAPHGTSRPLVIAALQHSPEGLTRDGIKQALRLEPTAPKSMFYNSHALLSVLGSLIANGQVVLADGRYKIAARL